MTATPRFTSPGKGEVGREAAGRGSGRRFARTEQMTKRARTLRGNLTDAELKLWRALRRDQINGFNFRRQHPVGRYTLDFYCSALRLAIEIDGGQHAKASSVSKDLARTAALSEKGIMVVRFWNNDVIGNLAGVLDEIARITSERALTPSPALPLSGGGRTGALP